MSLCSHSIPFLLILLIAVSPASAENTKFVTDHFTGSGNCSQCHDGLRDIDEEDVSIVRAWSGSIMANAAKDPLWQAKVATELKRNPHLEDAINDKCTQCHAPMANFESEEQVTLFGEDGLLDSSNSLHDAAMNAVSCTYCHQIENSDIFGTEEGFSGNAEISPERVAYGPFNPFDKEEMTQETGHEPVFSEHISSSALCATCHNLKTPYVDATGAIAGDDFPEQMPYTEWENSIFDDAGSNPTSCQDCHMPTTTAILATRPGQLPAREGFARHNFAGANTVMLTLLRDNADTLDVDPENIDENIALSRQLLQEAVSLEILSAEMEGTELVARLRLTNNSGHKTPTSFPSRRMWLHFKVTDADGNLVFESGAINPDGSIDGANNDTDPSMLEPHYELITSADQVQIYESVLGNTDGDVTQTLLRAAEYLKDNRLTPAGFDKNRVPDDVAVKGTALDDLNFNEGLDEITYRIRNYGTGDLSIAVSLNYQPLSHGMLEDLFKDNDLEEVSSFESMYDSLTLKHETMAIAKTIVKTSTSTGGGGGSIGMTLFIFLSMLVAAARFARKKTALKDHIPSSVLP